MSHFTVMVIGENPEEQLRPYHEYECTGIKDKHVVFVENDEYDIDDETDKKGHWTNPNSKWDWYSLGGRWSGMIKLRDGATGINGRAGTFGNETGIDQARKGDIINFVELTTFAVIKDGKWYERGEMGWFGVVSDEKEAEQWAIELKKLVEGLPDETLISIFDCHI